MCIRDGTLDFIDIHKEFSKQGSAIKPLFDTNDVSGVHISSSGEAMRDIFHILDGATVEK